MKINEKIGKLVSDCHCMNDGDKRGFDKECYEFSPEELDTLITLIVQECVKLCDIATEQSRETYDKLLAAKEDNACLATALGASYQSKILSKSLKNHFGVK